MTTETSDFWYRAARHAHEEEAKDHHTRLARIASKYSYSFHVFIFQSPDDSLYYTVAAGNLSPRARKEVKQFFRGSSITLSPRDLAFVRKYIAEQHQRDDRAASTQGKGARIFEKNSDRRRMRPDQPGVAGTNSSAQADQTFYEKKERLLRRVQAGTATQTEKEWLKRWGFLEQAKPQQKSGSQSLNPTHQGSPTKTGPVYRYRGSMKATPVAKLEGPGGPGTHKNSYGKLVASKREQRGERRSVFVKYQSMR